MCPPGALLSPHPTGNQLDSSYLLLTQAQSISPPNIRLVVAVHTATTPLPVITFEVLDRLIATIDMIISSFGNIPLKINSVKYWKEAFSILLSNFNSLLLIFGSTRN